MEIFREAVKVFAAGLRYELDLKDISDTVGEEIAWGDGPSGGGEGGSWTIVGSGL
jgi:hypothetical protein